MLRRLLLPTWKIAMWKIAVGVTIPQAEIFTSELTHCNHGSRVELLEGRSLLLPTTTPTAGSVDNPHG